MNSDVNVFFFLLLSQSSFVLVLVFKLLNWIINIYIILYFIQNAEISLDFITYLLYILSGS